MPLAPKVNPVVASDSKSAFIYDATGNYDPVTNPGGYGGINPLASTAATATLGITLPDGTVIAPINIYPTLPNITDVPFVLTNVMIGLAATDPMPDGSYLFTYVITGTSGTPYTATSVAYKFLTGQACCCVAKLAAKTSSDNCECTDEDKENFSNAWDLLELAKDAAACGKRNEADEYLTSLSLICSNLNCQCC